MRFLWLAVSALATLGLAHHPRRPAKRHYDTHNYYIVEHAVTSGPSIGDVAFALGVEVVEQLGELEDHWVVRSPKLSQDLEARGYDPVLDAYHSLRNVAQDGQLAARSNSDESIEFSKRLYESIAYLERQELEEREKRAPPPIKPPPKASAIKKVQGITDPYFTRQWHLANDEYPQHMMNVSGLWAEGFTGKGVLSGLIDDGLDYTSDDLAANFDAKNSYDFNDHEALPTPKKDRDHHGTRCAGQIAAVKNDVCGIGIAYESKVSGIRILSGRITTADEAIALNYGYQDVSLYSCSWGPRDDGTKMQGPSYIIRKAVLNGINKGRGGKGSIFVFASGNGGHKGDQCNFDGYTNSIYSVTVSAVDYKGFHPRYSETCSANMIVAYSSGSGNHIVTTDKGKNECATTHGGTSAAAPNAVGVFALALQARPDLTWRDIQYLCVETALRINPGDPDWARIANGKYYSNKYGFGALDGWAYVQAAKTWKLVKPQAWIETPTIQLKNGTMDMDRYFEGGEEIAEGGVRSTMHITKEMLESNNFETLEHVNIRVWIDHTRRGDVEVELKSPTGIRSVLASQRERDSSKSGFPGWVFMSVKHWGDNPVGDWTITVSDRENDETGFFLGWNMILWGTTIDPSKAKQYEIDKNDDLLPPSRNGTITPTRPGIPSGEQADDNDDNKHKTLHPKPTADLPHEPSTPTGTPDRISSDGSWLSDLSSSKQNWLLGIVAIIILVNFGGAIYYCRRHFGLWGDDNKAYNALPGAEILPMADLPNAGNAQAGQTRSAGGRTLYDVLEEEDQASGGGATGQRSTAATVTAGPHAQARSTGGLGFHSGFLDDDDPLTAAAQTPKYRDEDSGAPSRVGPPPQPLQPPPQPVHHGNVTPEEETTSEEEANLWDDARAK